MRSQDKNRIIRNLRSFIESGNTGLREHQDEILDSTENFLRLPNGAEFVQRGHSGEEVRGFKKGNFLEVVSATGSGKTRAFGTMAKAMDMPTLKAAKNCQARLIFSVTLRNQIVIACISASANRRVRAIICDQRRIHGRQAAGE